MTADSLRWRWRWRPPEASAAGFLESPFAPRKQRIRNFRRAKGDTYFPIRVENIDEAAAVRARLFRDINGAPETTSLKSYAQVQNLSRPSRPHPSWACHQERRDHGNEFGCCMFVILPYSTNKNSLEFNSIRQTAGSPSLAARDSRSASSSGDGSRSQHRRTDATSCSVGDELSDSSR